MSNEAYEKLHKLVKYLIKNKIIEAQEISRLFKMDMVDFLSEFEEELTTQEKRK